MRIVVVSDTHRNYAALRHVVETQPGAGLFIHLGDGEAELRQVKADFPDLQFLSVQGNCDSSSEIPAENVLEVAGKRIFYTHGHRYSVKYGMQAFEKKARMVHADIALYGHTHIPEESYRDGLYIMNPGSLGSPARGGPTYGTVDITPAGVVLHIIDFTYR